MGCPNNFNDLLYLFTIKTVLSTSFQKSKSMLVPICININTQKNCNSEKHIYGAPKNDLSIQVHF